MRKIKMFFVSLLAMMLALFCFASCGEVGKYNVVSFVVSNTETTLTDNTSYVELKKDNVADVSITVEIPFIGEKTLAGEGTWEKGEEKNTYVITISGIEYDAVKDGKKLTINVFVIKFNFEK